MTVQGGTVRSLGIALLGAVVAVVMQVVAPASAQAQVTLPESPTITLTAASCQMPQNTLVVNMPAGFTNARDKENGYRFVVYVGDTAIKQLNTAERQKLYDATTLAGEDFAIAAAYGKQVTVKAFWFDRHSKLKDYWVDGETKGVVKLQVGGQLERAVALNDSRTVTLVDPQALDCRPATAPKLDATMLPAAPVVSLHPATCDVRKNILKLESSDNNTRYRFIVSLGDYKVQLKSELRDMLSQSGKLELEEVIEQHYPQLKGMIPYGQVVGVQAYYFDEKAEYEASLYDTALQLTVGASDRFIKLGDVQSATIIQHTDASCQSPVNPVNPAPVQPQPIQPVPVAPAPFAPVVAPAVIVPPKTVEVLADTGETQDLYAVAGVLAILFGVAVLRRLS